MGYTAEPIFFLEASNVTREIRAAMQAYYNTWLPNHSSESDLVLYHYTNLEGLRGIVSNRSIWFTHTSTLNDPLELKYGKNLIEELLNNRIIDENNENIRQLLEGLKTGFRTFEVIDYHTYVACFCSENNLLSQWRNYADKGGGFNLGFILNDDTKFYHDLENNISAGHIILRKIIYDFDQQTELVSTYLTSIIDAAKIAIDHFEEHGGLPTAWASTTSMDVVNILFDLMLSFKNPVFKEENEWRLIKSMQANCRPELIHFRGDKNKLIPFINTYVASLVNNEKYFPLKSIKYGPIREIENIKSALSLLINKEANIVNHIKLDVSSIEISAAGFEIRR